MNAQEGVKRIAIAVRVIGGIAAFLYTGLAVVKLLSDGFPMFLAILGIALACLVAGFGLAWIIEGFAKKP